MKTRIISAFVAAVLVIPLLILGGYPFYIGVGLLALLGYKEILDLKKDHKPVPNLIVLFGLISVSLLVLSNFNSFSLNFGITYQRIIITLLLLLVPTIFYKNELYTTRDAFYLIGATLLIGLVFNLFIVIRNRGLYLLLYLIAIPMFTDIAAMLTGKFFGKTKLCPKISPHKTWEGSFGGLLFGTIAGVLIYSLLIGSFSIKIVFFSAILSIAGQIGDLIMSKVKRENEIKDFSNIMPGHGGILDRLDSIIFVLLAYLLLVFYI
ncbi:MAG: phosphatidate cytidylyltransferase [Bacilli bacterium]